MKHPYSAVPRAHFRTAELLLDERDPAVLQICATNLQISLTSALRCLYDAAGLPYLEGWGVVEYLTNARPDQLHVDQVTLDKVASYNRTICSVHDDLGHTRDLKAEVVQLEGLVQQIEPVLRQLRQGFDEIYAAKDSAVSSGSRKLNLQ